MKKKFTLGKKDFIFIAIVIAVITILSLGNYEKRTAPTPNDAIHSKVTARSQCLECHSSKGVRPQPKAHTKATQCFQCHTQPKSWSAKP
ncbi:MAG: hypothetical protein Q9M28_03210 [Mariprofundaceae bacterium]|nr:hypothetical protein [Mariprofundaceae bacterium]